MISANMCMVLLFCTFLIIVNVFTIIPNFVLGQTNQTNQTQQELEIMKVQMEIKSLESQIEKETSISPIFPRQVILDDSNDWDYTNFQNTTMCDINKSFLPGKPDIAEVNYLSDGRILNATLWLSSPPQEPKSTNQFMNISAEQNMTSDNNKIVIDIKPLPSGNLSLKDYTILNRLDLRKLPSYRAITENLNINFSHYPGRQVYYTYEMNNQTLSESKIWTVANNRSYTVTYTADNRDRYDSDLGVVQKIIQSMNIGQVSKDFTAAEASGFTKYSNQEANFSLWYPVNWTLNANEESKGKITLRPEYKDTLLKSSSNIVMSIDVNSGYDVIGEDYRVDIDWDPVRQSWTYELQESSHGGKDKILGKGEFSLLDERDDHTGFFNKEKNFIKISLDLSKLNFPDQYSLLFFATDSYESKNNNCSTALIDMTDEVHVPPPDFTLLTTPTSVSLRPGDVQNLELQMKNNNAKLNSFLILSTNESKQVMVDFIPDRTSVPRSGLATSLVRVEAKSDATARPYTFEINANITFPTELTSYLTKERFNNTDGARIQEHSFFTITVLPPYTDFEKFANFTNSVISPISGLWTFLAGVGAVVAPLIIYLKRPRKNRGQDDDSKK